nr:LacI family DNA-binding transcriptional regulator [uncultured Cohaesibacter sp.]
MTNTRFSKPTKATIKDVAEDAGVSRSAVSKVLTNAYGVSDSMREKVEKSIAKLGYRPSTAARGMRGSTYAIGVLLVEMENPFMAELVEGIRKILNDANYKMLVGVSEARVNIETSLIESMMDFNLDGLVIISPGMDPDLLSEFALQLPIVVLGQHVPEATTFDTVNSDDFQGARVAVQSLIEAGHKRIHMISIPEHGSNSDVFCIRETGYRAAMEDAGLGGQTRVHCMKGVRDSSIQDQLARLLVDENRPSAFFCWSDIHALQLIDLAEQSGIALPDDLSIVGYDNSKLGAHSRINLSSVDQKGEEMGALAAKAILSRIEGRQEAEHHIVPPELMLRKSSGLWTGQ